MKALLTTLVSLTTVITPIITTTNWTGNKFNKFYTE
ncbi:MAG: hypothetical protein PPFGHCPK_00280 [Spiroplasma endosymbiont of Drosophila atripex]|nr:MAG: hypothetical protein PPFGHCPK_00280 [Spiroplasma endosymbiont of Drosophila atripex]